MKFLNENFEPRCVGVCMIFGGGGFFGSGAKTTVNDTTNNVNQEDYSGTVAREGSTLSIIQREESPEALEAARQLGLGGLSVADNAVAAIKAGARDAFDFSSGVVGGSLDAINRFGNSAFSTVEQALGKTAGAYETAADYQERALDRSLDFVGNLQDVNQKTLGQTVAVLNDISREQNKSTDQRVAEISGNAIKYVSIAAALIGLGVVGWAIWGRK